MTLQTGASEKWPRLPPSSISIEALSTESVSTQSLDQDLSKLSETVQKTIENDIWPRKENLPSSKISIPVSKEIKTQQTVKETLPKSPHSIDNVMDTSAFANEEVSLPIIDDSFITPEKISLTKPLNSEYDWPRTPPSGLQPLAPEILTTTKITKELTEDYSRDKIEGSEHSWPRVPEGDNMIVREPPKQVMKNQNLDDPVSRKGFLDHFNSIYGPSKVIAV